MRRLAYFLFFTQFIFGCRNEGSRSDEDAFPKVVKLDSLKETDFLEAFDKRINLERNGIYCFTINEALEQAQNAHAQTPTKYSNPNLEKLVAKKFHQNVLNSDEYSVQVLVEANVIEVIASIDLNLPFELYGKKYPSPFLFNNSEEVKAFTARNSRHKHQLFDLNYYVNDDNFSILITPKNKEHQIILIKGDFRKKRSLKKVFDDYSKNLKNANLKREKDDFYWKNYLLEEDQIIIPNFSFNIEHNYAEYQGNTFYVGTELWSVEEFYQRIAFVLNEKGAQIKSQAKIEEKKEEKEERKPKNLVFDKPFVLFIKRIDKDLPYFGMYVANSELMEAFDE